MGFKYINTVNTKILAFSLCIIYLFFPKNAICAVSNNDFNIVLISIDALRADHLSCYSYERETSPNIDKIAEKGILFENVIAPSSWTVPSMVSLFTSVYPINHGVISGFLSNNKVYKQEVLSDKLTTLAEILKENGYATFGVASNLHLSEKSGLARGFDYFKCLPFLPAPYVNGTIHSWEDEIKKSDKFFLWVHYFDPHLPYIARKPWIEQYTSKEMTEKLNFSKKHRDELSELIPVFKKYPQTLSNLIALYDSEINYVDSYLGELIEKFELDKNTLIIITSDHGEGFLEHGMLGHGNSLYKETTQIPLIIKLPHSTKKETVKRYVNLVDIMPSILHISSIALPEHTLGESLWEKKGLIFWLKKMFSRNDASNYNFSELDKKSILKTIMTSKWKYIYNYQDKTEQLYNIKSDLLELNNLTDKNIRQRNKLKEQLLNWVSNSKTYPTKRQAIQLSPIEKEKLETLGYLSTQEPGLKKSQKHLRAKREKKAGKKPQSSRMVDSEEANLKIVDGTGNTVGIDLTNNVPVRVVQFTLEGAKMTGVHTTSRTAGFLADFNIESGIVILVSTSGNKIATGTGLIAEIICDKGDSASLSGIKMAK